MREARRAKLMQLQLRLAGIARREALAELSRAAEYEARTAALAGRSRAMADDYRQPPAIAGGGALSDRGAFVAALEEVAGDAERANRKAMDAARREMQALAASENREKRLGERLGEARRILRETAERREQGDEPVMARGLQGKGGTVRGRTRPVETGRAHRS